LRWVTRSVLLEVIILKEYIKLEHTDGGTPGHAKYRDLNGDDKLLLRILVMLEMVILTLHGVGI
jgi:hypothetical protein